MADRLAEVDVLIQIEAADADNFCCISKFWSTTELRLSFSKSKKRSSSTIHTIQRGQQKKCM